MIKVILSFNNYGKQWLTKFYQPYGEDTPEQIIRDTFHLVSKSNENIYGGLSESQCCALPLGPPYPKVL
uniref:AP complex mu/sigma subunit domain-containing protein n=1 Tax=Panthera leo TaxID=9689 RepID=A0A8C8Y0R1_PANLE